MGLSCFIFTMLKLALVVLAVVVMQFSGVSAQCDCTMEIDDAASSTDNLLLDVQADLLDQMGELFDWISELKHTIHAYPPRVWVKEAWIRIQACPLRLQEAVLRPPLVEP